MYPTISARTVRFDSYGAEFTSQGRSYRKFKGGLEKLTKPTRPPSKNQNLNPNFKKSELKNLIAYFAYLQNSKMKNWNQLFKDFDHSFLPMVLDNLSKVLVNLSEDGSILKDFGISFKAFCQLKDWPNAISFEL